MPSKVYIKKGRDLELAMKSMIVWLNKHIPDTYQLEDIIKVLTKDQRK